MVSSTPQQPHRNLRIISVVAATAIALSCGTNYAYSAWEPDFADRMNLTATQGNLMGNFANIGMYAMGIPGGILIDKRGPRWGVLLGVVGLAVGYFPLHKAYDMGPGSMSLPALCFFSLMTGIASCTAFSAALKVSALNWPNHRGTATGLPLSAFGLSAFFWTTVSGFAFPDDTSSYLLLLAVGTTSLVLLGMIFLKVAPVTSPYEALQADERPGVHRRDSSRLRKTGSHSRTNSGDDEEGEYSGRGGTSTCATLTTPGETSSLVSSSPGDIEDSKSLSSHRKKPDITGWTLLKTPNFYKLWLMLGMGCGIGLMTINNIGNNTRQLWHSYDENVSHEFVQKSQLFQVGLISLFSFAGRLSSGIGSDFLVARNLSRLWTIVTSASIFTLAQMVALSLTNPNYMWVLSVLTGLAYGQLFGVFPALVADAFGTSGMAINWGAMTLAPVISGNFFNLAYGSILDQHSRLEDAPNGRKELMCDYGKACYSGAYWITFFVSVFAVVWALGCIRHNKRERIIEEREELAREHQP